MDTFEKIRDILSGLLDCEPDEINMETYMIQELDAESIDLLELALEMADYFAIDVKDDDLFLRNLRYFIKEAEESKTEVVAYLAGKLPHLSHKRCQEALEDLDKGPVLKVKDLAAYAGYHLKG